MMKISWACTKQLLHLACSSPCKDVKHYGTFTASSQHVSNMYVYTSSTRTRRGGSCLRVILEVFLSTELASAVRRPGPCARALCEPVALLLSKNRTCARPRCNATPSKHFLHGSHFALHSSHPALHPSHLHFTLHSSSQLISSELFSSHFISSHMS